MTEVMSERDSTTKFDRSVTKLGNSKERKHPAFVIDHYENRKENMRGVGDGKGKGWGKEKGERGGCVSGQLCPNPSMDGLRDCK